MKETTLEVLEPHKWDTNFEDVCGTWRRVGCTLKPQNILGKKKLVIPSSITIYAWTCFLNKSSK